MLTADEKVTDRSIALGSPDIKCSNVVVEFIDRVRGTSQRVLDGLNLEAHATQIVALLGRSGCGKSTLLRTLAGLQSLTSGDVRIGGNKPADALSTLSFVFQEPALLPWRTAIENVALPLELRNRFSKSDCREKAQAALRVAGFSSSDEGKLPPQLSGGMKMRVSLARALATDPRLLLMDEPFAALDDMLRWRLNGLILDEWLKAPRTIVFVTHNIAEAIFISHRIAIMNRGKIVAWIENPLAAPRTVSIRSSDEFAKLYGYVSQQLASFTEIEA